MAVISKKPFSLTLLVFFTTIFLKLFSRVNSSKALSFSFNEFATEELDLIFQGDAHLTSLSFDSNVLQLTNTNSTGEPQENTVGRVLYSAPMRLYVKGAGKVSHFESNINFVLTKPSSKAADGLAFFIAPMNSKIPKHSKGGFLGLFNETTAFNSSTNQIVAIEFDTYNNTWDPSYPHIGININSINSSANVRWDIVEGDVFHARITYDGLHKNLNVTSFYFESGGDYSVSYMVDLPSVLPEWVRVGITASSGDDGVQVHSITSWDFKSGLELIE
ncbi:hypothetical protein RIF29_11557 [Crotalaria pallida]|uniref:Legume lectin domain-containing protein n=1 Tax=Crotalaria pallida TaxID=3830 RepID=A0AAN9IM97_CROPI